MATGAPDYLRLTTQRTKIGVAVTLTAGSQYYSVEASLAAGADPTYTPTFALANICIKCDEDIVVKFNDAGNDAITIEAGAPFVVDNLEITSIIVANANACDIKIYGSD